MHGKKNISWRDSNNQNGSSGSFGDLTSHLLDLICYICKSEVDLNSIKLATGIRISTRGQAKLTVDDYSLITGSLYSNTIFKAESTKSAKDNIGFRFDIVFQKATIEYSSISNKFKIHFFKEDKSITPTINHIEKLITPSTEIPYWADSFLVQNAKWLNSYKKRKSMQYTRIN